MSLKLKLIGAVLILALATWFGLQAMRPVAKVVPAIRDRAVNGVPGAVTVFSEQIIQVRNEVGGRVVESKLDLGAAVAPGDVLVELDKSDLDLQIDQLEHDREAIRRRVEIGSPTQFELQNARDQLALYERQLRLGAVTSADVEKQSRIVKQVEQRLQLEALASEQALAKADTELKAIRRKRALMTVRCTVAGTVSAIFVHPGDLISTGEVLAALIADKRIVEAKISEENFAGLRVGQRATVRFLSYGNSQYQARIEKILPAADPLTQRYSAYLAVEIDPKLLVPGITGEVNITVDAREQAIIIPRRALLGRNVFVVKNGRVELRTVDVGFASLNVVEIRKGIDEGEPVIVEDLDRFRAGDRVVVAAP